jgi:DNA-binding response OmpR family regulator
LGNNAAVVSDFFQQLENDFELMSTSEHFTDVENHIRLFEPDAILFCVDGNARKVMTNMVTVRQQTQTESIPFLVLGTREECDECIRMGVNIISHTIVKPISAGGIRNNITGYLDKIQTAEREEIRRMEKQQKEEEQKLQQLKEDMKEKTILLVDDDVAMVKTMKAFLEEEYKVATAVSGLVALRYLERKPVDLVFLDYEMPGMNGPQFLERMREHENMANIPVVFLTGASSKDKITNALSLKPQGYMLKPVSRDKLVEQAHDILG